MTVGYVYAYDFIPERRSIFPPYITLRSSLGQKKWKWVKGHYASLLYISPQVNCVGGSRCSIVPSASAINTTFRADHCCECAIIFAIGCSRIVCILNRLCEPLCLYSEVKRRWIKERQSARYSEATLVSNIKHSRWPVRFHYISLD